MFINEDFMLKTDTGKKLYHEYAKAMPIIDYHCHLDPELIESDYRFTSITELWLSDDHYKWRAMRANGVSEKYITGDGTDWEKFYAWADTVENLFGNALYHWTHLELKEYFGITELLTKENAQEIYDRCNKYLAENEITTKTLINHSNVKFIGTTDDILSDLEAHQAIEKQNNPFVVAPTFRPDPILNINDGFSDYLKACEKSNGKELKSAKELYQFLAERVNFFSKAGCKSADHGFKKFLYAPATVEEIEGIYQKGLVGAEITENELAKWQGSLMVYLGKHYAKHGWIMQIHFGAIRNNNSKLFKQIGRDVGVDSIADQVDVADNLNQFFDALDQENQLPKTIVYNLNATNNDLVAATCANFQSNEDGIKSKVQFGSGWWFNDTYTGMVNQLETLANQGILMNFVGMLTDSRSFISYTRHDYFRRILCDYVGEKVESGFYPNSVELLEKLVKGISFDNAKNYFDL